MWVHVGGHLLKGQLAINGGDLQAALTALTDSILDIQAGRAQLWVAIDDDTKRVLAGMVSEVIVGDDGHKVVWVRGMGGEHIALWGRPLSDTMAAFANAEGCEAVRFAGRKGLLRAYPGVRIVGMHETGAPLYERRVS
jgi:hypothetical protein